MDVFSLKNVINCATRSTTTSKTLIDLILTNSKSRVLQAGVIGPHISDHSLIFSILKAGLPRLRSQKITFRSLKNFHVENFLADLHNAPFVTVMNTFDDTDDKLFVFQTLVL